MSQYYPSGGGPAPPVVQGQPYYASPFGGQQQQYDQKPTSAAVYNHHPEEYGNGVASTKPQRQKGCRDVFWAILFYAHLAGIAFITIVYTPQVINGAMENYSNNNGDRLLEEQQNGGDAINLDINPSALISMTALMGILACILSSLALGFMIRFAEGLIKVRHTT